MAAPTFRPTRRQDVARIEDPPPEACRFYDRLGFEQSHLGYRTRL